MCYGNVIVTQQFCYCCWCFFLASIIPWFFVVVVASCLFKSRSHLHVRWFIFSFSQNLLSFWFYFLSFLIESILGMYNVTWEMVDTILWKYCAHCIFHSFSENLMKKRDFFYCCVDFSRICSCFYIHAANFIWPPAFIMPKNDNNNTNSVIQWKMPSSIAQNVQHQYFKFSELLCLFQIILTFQIPYSLDRIGEFMHFLTVVGSMQFLACHFC